MNKKTVSIILLIIFLIGLGLTAANVFLDDTDTENQTGNITIKNTTVHYEKSGKCLEVLDGNTIQVYGVGRVQLTQVDTPQKGQAGAAEAKKFVEDRCLGKTVYLDIDDKNPHDKFDRTLAVVYTDSDDINRELLENNLAKISYFEPSEFKKGEV